MRRISHWVVRHAGLVLLLGAGLTLFFAAHLPDLELDPSAEGIMLERDPARLDYERIKEVFGSDSIIAIAIHRTDTIFRAATLAKIQQMARQLAALDGVERVDSLATTDNLADCREGLKPGPLYTDVPTTPKALGELRRQALANHVFADNLVSRDGLTAGIIVFVEVPHIDRGVLADALYEAVARDEPLPARLLAEVLYSPRFAEALRAALPRSLLDEGGGPLRSVKRAAGRHPEAVGRAALRLLRGSRRLRRTVIREAPAASRRLNARLVRQAQEIIERHSGDPAEEIYQVGIPVMKLAATTHQRRDLSRLLPCTLALVAVVLFIAFRSLTGMLIPLGTVVVSVLWTFGLMAALSVPITVITVAVGPLLVAVGNCYAMHVVTHYYQLAPAEQGRRVLAGRALETCFLPVLLAGLTTAVGFLSVTLSRLSSIREFGLFSAFGILSTVVVSLVVAPAVLRYVPLPRRSRPAPGAGRRRDGGLSDTFLRGVGRFDIRHGASIAVGGILVAAAALAGCFFVRVNTNYIGFFRTSDPVRVNSRRMHEELSGTVPFYVVLDARAWRRARPDDEDADWRGPFTDPSLLRFVLDLQRFIASVGSDEAPAGRRIVDTTVSFADQVTLMHRSYKADRALQLPATREEVEALLDFFYKREQGEKYISEDFTQANIYVRTHAPGSHVLGDLVRRIERYARENAPQGVLATVTGETILILRAADEISRGQVRSLVIAFVVIFTLMGVLFTSVKAGLLSIIPNAVPILGTFGLMGWLGISLNTGTSLVASIALGIAVDDTIHYMTGFNLEMRRLGDQTRAMLATLRLRGKAIVFTSVALFCGFMVLSASRFAPIVAFGYLTAIAMAAALLGDIVVLPVLLRRVELVTLWDLLTTRLRGDPREWVGVLRGLRASEAKRVVLLGRLRRVAKGSTVLQRGADAAGGPVWGDVGAGRTLYAVLSGRVELRAGSGPERRTLGTLGQGEIFGEAVLTPGGVRPPDAVAVEDTELLTIDEASLWRLARRYPRAAAKFGRNLVFVLADRLYRCTTPLGPPPAGSQAPPLHGPAQYALFEGLARRQERLIRSLAQTRTYEPEQVIVRRGERGREMFAVLSGRVAVTTGAEGRGVPIAELAKGGLFGELPAAADQPRAAEARAVERTEILVLTEDFLDRLMARSPRTTARWAMNLARTLSGRLDETAARVAELSGLCEEERR